MEGNCTLVPGGSPASNLLIMLKAEIEKCVVVFHMGLESFDYSEPSLNISLLGEQGVSSRWFNCTEPA